MLLNPVFGRKRQVDLCEFKANQLYITSPRTARLIDCLAERHCITKTNKTSNIVRLAIPGHKELLQSLKAGT